jgi:hypothetical protein
VAICISAATAWRRGFARLTTHWNTNWPLVQDELLWGSRGCRAVPFKPQPASRPIIVLLMRVSLPTAKHGSWSIRELIASIRRYRAAEISIEIDELIHGVAANSEISTRVVRKIRREAPCANEELFRIARRAVLLVVVLSPLLSRIPSVGNWLTALAIIATLEWTTLDCLNWRTKWRDAYLASYIIRALEFGLIFQGDVTDHNIRDGFAASIQRAATRFPILYKGSTDSTAFFSGQIRRQAERCRNDIFSLIPCLVTAGQEETRKVNADLARVLIRTQLGFWHQTADISRPANFMPLRYVIWPSLGSFFNDKSVRTAILVAIIAALVPFIGLIWAHIR